MVAEQYQQLVIRIVGTLNNTGARWCVCFGTLLSLIRDKQFDVNQDVDIGIIGGGRGAFGALLGVLPVSHMVIDDATREPLNVAFNVGGVSLDLFFWKERQGMAYHCYDEQVQRPANGVLSQYHFKGIPATIFWPTVSELRRVPKMAWVERILNGEDPDDPIGEVFKGDYTYNLPCPGMETEGIQLRIPFGFGAALDYWYPGCWARRNETYGVSKCHSDFTAKSCRGLWK
jgi:hypothetical protein